MGDCYSLQRISALQSYATEDEYSSVIESVAYWSWLAYTVRIILGDWIRVCC